MFLCTPSSGEQYVTDCEEAVLIKQAKLEPGFTYKEVQYLPTANIRHHLWACRARILAETDMDASFPDRKGRRPLKDPLMDQAIRELMEDF